MKILVTGKSGLIGQLLSKHLTDDGHQIIGLGRGQDSPENIHWSPKSNEINSTRLKDELFDGVIHLAGESISAGRLDEAHRKRVYDSRILGTKLLVESILKLDKKPAFFFSSSAVGYYGDRGDETLTETSKPGDGFLPKVCVDWEDCSRPLEELGVRRALLRTGIVLSTRGGALQKMLTPFKLGLGGKMGSGNQYMSWIDILDMVEIFRFLIKTPSAKGAFNLCAPHPVPQAEFSKTLASVLRRPAFFHAPEFIVKLALGELADQLLLASTRAIPQKLAELGYEFKHPQLLSSLQSILEDKR